VRARPKIISQEGPRTPGTTPIVSLVTRSKGAHATGYISKSGGGEKIRESAEEMIGTVKHCQLILDLSGTMVNGGGGPFRKRTPGDITEGGTADMQQQQRVKRDRGKIS